MTCTDCNTQNIDTANFCKNCGNNLLLVQTVTTTTEENTDKVVNLFILVIGAGLLIGLFYFVINMFQLIDIYSYKVITTLTNLVTPIATLVAAVLMPNKKAKTFLFIAFALELLFFVGYRLLQYL